MVSFIPQLVSMTLLITYANAVSNGTFFRQPSSAVQSQSTGLGSLILGVLNSSAASSSAQAMIATETSLVGSASSKESASDTTSSAADLKISSVVSSVFACLASNTAFYTASDYYLTTGYTTETIEQAWLTSTITSYANTYTTTLCDGYPRVTYSGNATSRVVTTSFLSPSASTTVIPLTTPKPDPCTVPTSVYKSYCTQIVQAYNASESAFENYASTHIISVSDQLPGAATTRPTGPPRPIACPSSLFGSDIETVPASGPECNIFPFGGQLFYWPVEIRGALCNQTTITPTPTGNGPNTAVVGGVTITSPSVAVSFTDLEYFYSSGSFTTNMNLTTLLVLPKEDVRTVCGQRGDGVFEHAYSFNYADFQNPVPYTAFYCANKGLVTDTSDHLPINVLTHAFNPRLRFPSSVYNNIVTKLPGHPASCLLPAQGWGLLDPPSALEQFKTMDGFTRPGSASALPTIVPTLQSQTLPTLKPSSLVSQPAKETAKSSPLQPQISVSFQPSPSPQLQSAVPGPSQLPQSQLPSQSAGASNSALETQSQPTSNNNNQSPPSRSTNSEPSGWSQPTGSNDPKSSPSGIELSELATILHIGAGAKTIAESATSPSAVSDVHPAYTGASSAQGTAVNSIASTGASVTSAGTVRPSPNPNSNNTPASASAPVGGSSSGQSNAAGVALPSSGGDPSTNEGTTSAHLGQVFLGCAISMFAIIFSRI